MSRLPTPVRRASGGNAHALQHGYRRGPGGARRGHLADQMPDDLVVGAGHQEQAGAVADEAGVVGGALARGPVDVCQGIVPGPASSTKSPATDATSASISAWVAVSN